MRGDPVLLICMGLFVAVSSAASMERGAIGISILGIAVFTAGVREAFRLRREKKLARRRGFDVIVASPMQGRATDDTDEHR